MYDDRLNYALMATADRLEAAQAARERRGAMAERHRSGRIHWLAKDRAGRARS